MARTAIASEKFGHTSTDTPSAVRRSSSAGALALQLADRPLVLISRVSEAGALPWATGNCPVD